MLNVIFFPVWFSIFASELGKVITLACYRGWNWQRKVRATVSGILLHGILLYRQQKLELRKQEALLRLSTDGGTDEKRLMDVEGKSQENDTLQSLIRVGIQLCRG